MGGSFVSKTSRTAVSVGLVLVAVLVGGAFSLVVVFAEPDLRTGIVALIVLAELGYAVTAIAFLWVSGRGLGYLDLPAPRARHVGYGLAGAVVLLASQGFVVVLLEVAGVATDTGIGLDQFPIDVVDAARDILPALVVVSLLVIGPAEELLFRNVVQKYLAEVYSTWGAIAVTSLLFALLHVPNYVTVPSATPVSVGLGLTFVISVVLGWLYARTETLLVPVIAHGVYDAVLFGLAYLRLAGWV